MKSDFNPEALNDPDTKRDLSQGAEYMRALVAAHTAGQQDAAQDTVNAYNPPRSCILPEELWASLVQVAIIFAMVLISIYRPLTWKMYGDPIVPPTS